MKTKTVKYRAAEIMPEYSKKVFLLKDQYVDLVCVLRGGGRWAPESLLPRGTMKSAWHCGKV